MQNPKKVAIVRSIKRVEGSGIIVKRKTTDEITQEINQFGGVISVTHSQYKDSESLVDGDMFIVIYE